MFLISSENLFLSDIIIFGSIDWNTNWQTQHRLVNSYLNEGHRQMPVVFRNEQLTLGQLWSKYNRDYSKGLSKEALAEYDEALTFLTIRVPADSISGIRALRFRGWTNQKGAGSLLHPKDKEYSGGADHDSDSIKIFQGLGNELIDHYKRLRIILICYL